MQNIREFLRWGGYLDSLLRISDICRHPIYTVIFAIALTFSLSLAPSTSAYAEDSDDVENVTFSIPTKIQFKIKADGTVISPSNWAMSVPGGQAPVTITDISTTNMPDGIELTGASEMRTLLSNNGKDTQDGRWEYSYKNGKSTFKATGQSDNNPLVTAYGDNEKGRCRFDWNLTGISDQHNLLSKAAEGETSIGTVTFHVQAVKQAFAIYSDTDNSLDFYKRINVPKSGKTFEGKNVTNVYTGFETDEYICTDYGQFYDDAARDATISTPWYDKHADIKSVAIIDNGIRPTAIRFWFENFFNCTSLRLNKLDTSLVTSLENLFCNCYNATRIDVNDWNVTNVISMRHTFIRCQSMRTIDISKWHVPFNTSLHNTFGNDINLESILFSFNTSNVIDFALTFYECSKLTIDCTDWDVSSDQNHFKFNGSLDDPICLSLNVTLPKPWQAGVFAIYSGDDGSLDFYNRSNIELPQIGILFNNKTVTNNYTGFENASYNFINGAKDGYTAVDTPWYEHANDISSVTVVDDGIQPTSTGCFFARLTNVTSYDISKLDLSHCQQMYNMFVFNRKIESLDLTALDVSNVTDFNCMFQGCTSLKNINLSTWDTSKAKHFYGMFYNCPKLTDLNIRNTFVTSSANSIGCMFGWCTSLTSIDCSKWDVSNVSNMAGTFYKCTNLESVGDISGWDTSNVRIFSDITEDDGIRGMFSGASKLRVDCSEWNVSNVTARDDFAKDAPNITLPAAWR